MYAWHAELFLQYFPAFIYYFLQTTGIWYVVYRYSYNFFCISANDSPESYTRESYKPRFVWHHVTDLLARSVLYRIRLFKKNAFGSILVREGPGISMFFWSRLSTNFRSRNLSVDQTYGLRPLGPHVFISMFLVTWKSKNVCEMWKKIKMAENKKKFIRPLFTLKSTNAPCKIASIVSN